MASDRAIAQAFREVRATAQPYDDALEMIETRAASLDASSPAEQGAREDIKVGDRVQAVFLPYSASVYVRDGDTGTVLKIDRDYLVRWSNPIRRDASGNGDWYIDKKNARLAPLAAGRVGVAVGREAAFEDDWRARSCNDPTERTDAYGWWNLGYRAADTKRASPLVAGEVEARGFDETGLPGARPLVYADTAKGETK